MGHPFVGTVAGRFWAKVIKTEDCWIWIGARTKRGYGVFGPHHGQALRAHRVAWELTYGPIPEGLRTLHKCDTPFCVRPDHLFLGTDADNNHDMFIKGRANKAKGETHCRAKLTESDVREIRNLLPMPRGQRVRLAKQYGVTYGAIWAIASGKNWAWLK